MTFLGPDTVTILWCAGFAVVVLGVGGAVTEVGPWYASLRKPSWQPPNWLFGPAWTVIGVCSAWAAVVAWGAADATQRIEIQVLFVINGVLNIAWSLLFFKLQRPDWALIEVVPLWLSVLALAIALFPIASKAGFLLLPYLVWVAIAAYLNKTVVRLNAPFRPAANQEQRLPGA